MIRPTVQRRIDSAITDKLQENIGIPKDFKKYTTNVSGKQDSNRIVVEVEFCYKHDGYYFENLPPELNNKINDYLDDTLKLSFVLNIPTDYPFIPPIWILSDISTTISNYKLLISYYSSKVISHNEINSKNWSPVILIDKDILGFINTIINFDEVIANIYS